MVSEIKIDAAFNLDTPIIDVRSPSEFDQGHIPGAINIPLFSDEERAQVGTVYKQQSKEAATKLGYEYVQPKLNHFIKRSSEVARNNEVIVHCWRGGMRSFSFAKHLTEKSSIKAEIIHGGYKAYRNFVLDSLAFPLKLNVLGGYTGSGKTHILHELKKRGHQIIDLEYLANHKGSAFGGIGLQDQPTVEQFENNLHDEWSKLDLNKPVWVEDESHQIGSVKIPMPLFSQMREAELYFIDIPNDERAKHLVTEYAGCNNDLLADSIQRISKRLGGQREKKALEYLDEGNYYEVAMITLHYYDKYYLRGMKKRDSKKVTRIPLPSTLHSENALKILNTVNKK